MSAVAEVCPCCGQRIECLESGSMWGGGTRSDWRVSCIGPCPPWGIAQTEAEARREFYVQAVAYMLAGV